MAKLKTPIVYYGGKCRLAPEIIRLFPDHHTYIEPFFGGGAVFFTKPPSETEVINDLNGDVVNFFRVLRDHPAELRRLLELTPFAREEHQYCREHFKTTDDPIEKARMFYVLTRQSFSTRFGDAWRISSQRGHNFSKKLDDLELLSARLATTFIESRPALDVISRMDGSGVLFYLDPPYVLSSRTRHGDAYECEMTDQDHLELLDLITKLKGYVVLSGYTSAMYEERLSDWRRCEYEVQCCSARFKQFKASYRREMVWVSPNVPVNSMIL